MPSVLAPYDTATGYLSTRSGVRSIGLAAGMTGATASSRYAGATASGAPVAGTFAVGDWIIDQTGKIYVATVAGSPGTWVQVGSGGGGASITQVTFAESTAAPNATVYVDSITAAGSTTDVDLALRPKGYGALTAQVADSTVTGGNKRGIYAVDWQMNRAVASQVASSGYAVIGGGRENTVSATYSSVTAGFGNSATSGRACVSGGSGNIASNLASYVGGGDNGLSSGANATVGGGWTNTASAQYAVVPGGAYGKADLYGKLAHASGQFAASGDAQFGLHVCRATTTTNATAVLTADGAAVSATNHTVIAGNRVVGFRIDLIANSASIGTSTTDYGAYGAQWTITGLIRRATGVGSTTIIGTPYVTANADASLQAVTVAVTAETVTYGSLQVTVGGLAATNIHWVGQIQTTEVG